MATSRANHPDGDHDTLKSALKSDKKYVRVRGDSEILSIRDENHWQRMLEHRRMLVCPDPGCGKSLKITERRKPRLTRYISDSKFGGCSHLAPTGGGASMTDEHAWLQGRLRQICARLGYEARLEADFGNSRVDLLVASDPPYAIEVQRGDTDFTDRANRRRRHGMKTVWILPTSNDPKNSAAPDLLPLFTGPCVRLRYYSRPDEYAWQVDPSYLQNEVWSGAGGQIDLRVGVTVGTLAADGLTFHSTQTTVETFLFHVLSGRREWSPEKLITKDEHSWSGWVKVSERREYDAARQARAEEAGLRRRAIVRKPALARRGDSEVATQPGQASVDEPEADPAPAKVDGGEEKSVSMGEEELRCTAEPCSVEPTLAEEPAAPSPQVAQPKTINGVQPESRWRRWWRRIAG